MGVGILSLWVSVTMNMLPRVLRKRLREGLGKFVWWRGDLAAGSLQIFGPPKSPVNSVQYGENIHPPPLTSDQTRPPSFESTNRNPAQPRCRPRTCHIPAPATFPPPTLCRLRAVQTTQRRRAKVLILAVSRHRQRWWHGANAYDRGNFHAGGGVRPWPGFCLSFCQRGWACFIIYYFSYPLGHILSISTFWFAPFLHYWLFDVLLNIVSTFCWTLSIGVPIGWQPWSKKVGWPHKPISRLDGSHELFNNCPNSDAMSG